MPKYTPPTPSVRDALACLPPVTPPLGWRLSFLPVLGNSTQARVVVELCYTQASGAQHVWRRWGGPASTTSPAGCLSKLLQAAQEASWYLEGLDEATLRKRVEWDLGVLFGTDARRP